ncbi:MAG: rod shape-determining protein MreC [Gemmatimonadota bacterium]|nr:rod shape-determining protein MreC [Gemmatimonadota bacterium]MDE2873479.1 rod shape-determining protein MreC [Gemmatimonadota bacterium]
MAGQPRHTGERRKTDLLLAVGVILGSLIVLNLPPGPQRAMRHFMRETVLSPFIGINGAIARTRERALDFDLLRTQMDSLVAPVAAQRTLAEENRQLRNLLGLKDRPSHRVTAVTVIRAGTPGSESTFQLDAGLDGGISPFNAVVTESGLLGQVQEVFSRYSMGYDWSHRDFRVSAMTPDGRAHGLVEAVRGGFREQDRLVLRGTAYLSDLGPGDELVTSGRGGTFPRGIRIGWISGPAEASAGWSRSYYVEPAVHPGAVTHALVHVGGGAGVTVAAEDSVFRPRQVDPP